MRPQDKKTLKAIITDFDNAHQVINTLLEKLQEFSEAHQEWMDERDYETDGKFSETPTGERAEDEQYNIDDWADRLDTIINDLDDLQDEMSNNI